MLYRLVPQTVCTCLQSWTCIWPILSKYESLTFISSKVGLFMFPRSVLLMSMMSNTPMMMMMMMMKIWNSESFTLSFRTQLWNLSSNRESWRQDVWENWSWSQIFIKAWQGSTLLNNEHVTFNIALKAICQYFIDIITIRPNTLNHRFLSIRFMRKGILRNLIFASEN